MSWDRPDVRLVARDFRAGYLETPEPDLLPAGALVEGSRNVELVVGLSEAGARAIWRKRRGAALVTPAPMIATGTHVDGLAEFRRTGEDPRLLAVAGGTLHAFDGVQTMIPVAGGGGFTAGQPARVTAYRGQAYVYDGTQQRRYDGTTVRGVGLATPTDVVPLGVDATGATGTYEARYTWYDALTDHESSPSEPTAAVVYVNQGRLHTMPASPVPPEATHWRIYVRRVDTYEFNFYRVLTVLVGQPSIGESVSDEVRRRDLAPRDFEHDPPPGAWAILVEWKGFGIGVLPGDDQFSVSKQENLQAWHPKHRFAVGRGDGEAIKAVKRYGADLLLQKPHATWRLVGDAVPFKVDPLHSRYGCVSQEAGVEVHDRYFAWDREQGPYVTNTVTWRPLADQRIEGLVARVTKTALDRIRAVYVESADLVCWLVPLDGQTRARTILAYSVALDAWWAPWTGLELTTLATYTTFDGALGTYAGDEWGRLFRLLEGDREGLPTLTPVDVTHTAVVTSATAQSVTVSGAHFYTEGSGCAGLPVAVQAPGGSWQWRRIASNTADTLTLDVVNDAPWTVTPEAGWTVIVGGIEWQARTPVLDVGWPEREKSFLYLFVRGKATSPQHAIGIAGHFDAGALEDRAVAITTGTAAGLWGQLVWGQGLWGSAQRETRKLRVERTGFLAQFTFSNPYPSQPLELTMWQLWADLTDQIAPSATVED